MVYNTMQNLVQDKNIKFTTSLPSNTRYEDLSTYGLNYFKKFKPFIYDVNVTSRVDPFDRDAHGVNLSKSQAIDHMNLSLRLQEKTGVTVSFLFNNIYVPPTKENLNLFIENFKPWYEKGVRSITIPHLLWMNFGKIKETFPELSVKDTVLRECRSSVDFWNHANAGFDYVNIDRRLMRDLKELKKIKKAKDKFFEMYKRDIKLSMLTSEGCFGNCPYWKEHYQHTIQNPNLYENNENVFDIPKKTYGGCESRNTNNFKNVDLLYFMDNISEIFDCVDIVKRGGRRHGPQTFLGSLEDVLKYMNYPIIKIKDINIIYNDIIDPLLNDNKNDFRVPISLIKSWKNNIKNCKWECWNCDICEELNIHYAALTKPQSK